MLETQVYFHPTFTASTLSSLHPRKPSSLPSPPPSLPSPPPSPPPSQQSPPPLPVISSLKHIVNTAAFRKLHCKF
ncbi:conserved hypothetical protein [Ricinus communis]|uniref:Uncharacterized protein n=1 Tax=Ricinus communis TaxID=3988 RepID=B9SPY5_RICCO|nr:conserved hypothetical protein [Ricinus communis]